MRCKETRRALLVMQAYLDGAEIEREAAGHWLPCNEPCWDWNSHSYRIKQTPDEIDWSEVMPVWTFMARDGQDDPMFFTEEPTRAEGHWECPTGEYTLVTQASYRRGSLPWYLSLIKRPDS